MRCYSALALTLLLPFAAAAHSANGACLSVVPNTTGIPAIQNSCDVSREARMRVSPGNLPRIICVKPHQIEQIAIPPGIRTIDSLEEGSCRPITEGPFAGGNGRPPTTPPAGGPYYNEKNATIQAYASSNGGKDVQTATSQVPAGCKFLAATVEQYSRNPNVSSSTTSDGLTSYELTTPAYISPGTVKLTVTATGQGTPEHTWIGIRVHIKVMCPVE